ncbi:apurinic/apyrimidinic endonuclease family protein [Paenibacillus alginolyticus]|uniref:Sugar phosphate isomerase/epimerase n=1 Tax=Paenibacillus alginolyticus TaxID=59839 RepID=A0ABT4GLL3_9BACL|nr:hypothetical protein [Paenibacillus alginolyticus]MCY9697093.1 sugar phosphate isomerase/epimerase [Paenibacillus alginolyticus]MEC0146277.1 hypothetical protein [Paenibacillus alginolyticus]
MKALYDPGNDMWDPDAGIEAVAIGSGRVDYRGLFQRLLDNGYDDYLVVETHYRLHTALTEEQLKRPMGASFSDGGKEASEQCVRSLKDLLRELGA